MAKRLMHIAKAEGLEINEVRLCTLFLYFH